MLIIRLQRVGKKNQPMFRVVLTEKTAPPKGRYIEKLGYLDPVTKKNSFNTERINYWISKGAQPSDTVWNLLVKNEIIKEKKRPVKIKTKKEKKATKVEKPEAETK
ncbi:MAG TPA: 30S ribosomal protein S16 [Candidatus Paceibacterota bacterium]|jgi:small subunit ribosomal protein S16|nr:30S ribosomal protein S16 [Candidatus Pacearchaeota archaeon]HPZ74753.1 30S ribosomal protein S16 [Candidatus Pacearchaeota archaeon]HQD89238.1 30S ribosomal protein S16 [Candidatus Pacearchaeota archaeon]HRR39210.1 30S ribosomal protein S16 [Candidatus Paceibacterota bacterium]